MEVGRSSFGNSEASSDITEMDLPPQGRKRVNNNKTKKIKKQKQNKTKKVFVLFTLHFTGYCLTLLL